MAFNVLNLFGWLKGGVTTPVSAADPLPIVGTVGLDENSLIALENVTINVQTGASIAVNNLPATYPLPDSQVALLRKSTMQELLAQGVLYIGGGKVTVTNNIAVLQIANPAGSGKNLIVSKFFLASDTTIDVQFRKNATVASPTVQTSDALNFSSAVPAVGIVRTGSTGYTANGTIMSPVGRLLANVTTEFETPLIIPPGQQASAAFAAGALETVNAYASVVWAEVPV